MESSKIPPVFKRLLEGSPFESSVLGLFGACDTILEDNKMPFFPAYTDHGAAHLSNVLEAGERLIPGPVAEGELEAADSAVLLGAACLHDLALHLREPGFVSLISGAAGFEPLPWFDSEQPGRPADKPWPELWRAFRKQARHFSQSELDRLLGPAHSGTPQIAFDELDTRPDVWTEGDRLLIGEFIRRHHARLAHEIAIHGLPGIPEDEFPVLKTTMPQLADAIGATARSHNESLRTALDYVRYRAGGNPRLDGALLPYLMGLLRIADYFQIQGQRASPLLLHLREPQSPQSIEEWKKHQAIRGISWGGDDPLAIYIQASPSGSLRTHLQLGELVEDLQRELDLTTAVLSETYNDAAHEALRLAYQRVRTNLDDPSLHEQLDFLPRRARLRSAEDVFRLFISDLYGDEPAIGGRELLQNAVDAVRERGRWEAMTGRRLTEGEFRELPADVVVEIRLIDDERGELRVIDRGIGMTPSLVIDSFLTAGATFSNASDGDDDVDLATAVSWMKAGKFGVGAFASFLIGPEIQVTTRHPEERHGISFAARLDDDLVQLNRERDAPLGTEITVPFDASSLPAAALARSRGPEGRAKLMLDQIEAFYALGDPKVRFRLVGRDGEVQESSSTGEVPTPGGRLPDAWHRVDAPGFDAVLWSLRTSNSRDELFKTYSRLAHNGIAIRDASLYRDSPYEWSDREARAIIGRPQVAVFDTRHRLEVSLNRYRLVNPALPFERELLRSIGTDLLAHALVFGEGRYPIGPGSSPIVSRERWHYILPGLVDRYIDENLCVVWTDRGSDADPSKRFLMATASDPAWSRLPFRTAQRVDRRRSSSDSERDHWGFTGRDLANSTANIAQRTNMRPVAGVLVDYTPRWGAKLRALSEVLEREAPEPGATTWTTSVPIVPQREPSELEALLIRVAEDITEEPRPTRVGITVLRRADDFEPRKLGPVAGPWVEILGDGLARSEEGRLAQRAKAVEGNRELRTMVNKWERLKKRGVR